MNKTDENLQFLLFDRGRPNDCEAAKHFWSTSYMATHHESNIEPFNQRLPTADCIRNRHVKKQMTQKKPEVKSYYDTKEFKQKAKEVLARKKEDSMRMNNFRCKRIQLEMAAGQRLCTTNFL